MAEQLLSGKTAIVTGGGNGIGKAIVEDFIRNGALVHIIDVDDVGGGALCEKFNQTTTKVTFHYGNVSSHTEIKNIIDGITQTKSIDILVNNAGVGFVGNIEQTDEATLDRLYEINVKGVYNCIQACIGNMKLNKSGVILNIASIASHVGLSDRFAYAMSKGAVLAMTYAVAKDYINDNIRCNSISPARIHTPFVDRFISKNYPENSEQMFDQLAKSQPIGRMGEPQEVATMATFLCSDKTAFITGTDYPVDGGFLKLNN